MGDFDDSQHPRDEAGKFSDGGSSDGPKGVAAKTASANASRAHASMLANAPKEGAHPDEHQAHADRIKRVAALHKTAAKASSDAAREALDRGQFKESSAHSTAAIDHMTKHSDTSRAASGAESKGRVENIKARGKKDAEAVKAQLGEAKKDEAKSPTHEAPKGESGAKAPETAKGRGEGQKAGHTKGEGKGKAGEKAKGSESKGKGEKGHGEGHGGGLAAWVEKSIEKAREGVEASGEKFRETIKEEPLEGVAP